MFKPLRRTLAALLIGAGLMSGAAQAGPYSDLFVFGDSLSDTGNVLALSQTPPFSGFFPGPFPSFPGAPGRFSNGPIWVEHLANGLGLAGAANPARQLYVGGNTFMPLNPLNPFDPGNPTPGGNNYAWGGARTGISGSAGPTTGLLGQYVAWNGDDAVPVRAADPNALYVVVAGGNDLRDARSANPGNSAADDAARTLAAQTAVQELFTVVGALAQSGARHFLLSNLPDLGKTPEAAALGNVAASTDVTLKFNAALTSTASFFDVFFELNTGIDLDIRMMDLYGFGEAVVDDATNNGGAVFGITNVSSPCMTPVLPGVFYAPGSSDANCGNAQFSDDLHPSAVAHRLIGNLALSVAVPEPASTLLVALAVVGLLATRRRVMRNAA